MPVSSVGAVAAFVTTPLDVAKTRIMLAKVRVLGHSAQPPLAAAFKHCCQVMPCRQQAEPRAGRQPECISTVSAPRAEQAELALGQRTSITCWGNMDSVEETCLCAWLVLELGLVSAPREFPSQRRVSYRGEAKSCCPSS